MKLAVLLGASAFPGHGANGATMASPKFSASADMFHAYLTSPEHLNLRASQVLNLFDFRAEASDQRDEIREFFARSERPELVIFYYVGHGSYRPGKYVLHLRSSGDEQSGLSSYELLSRLPREWDDVPACFLVDACFAEGVAQDAATAMLEDSRTHPVVFLCSSSVLRKTYHSNGWGRMPEVTPFTEALLAALKDHAAAPKSGPLSAVDVERAMHDYIEDRNDEHACKSNANTDRAPKPKLAGSGQHRTIPLFPNPRTGSGQACVPPECKAGSYESSWWAEHHQHHPEIRSVPGWAFFVSTEDQFNYFRDTLTSKWPSSPEARAEAGLDGVEDVIVYELLGRHELLLMFHAERSGARAVRDFLLRASDQSPAAQTQIFNFGSKDEDFWGKWREKNNVTAFCFPSQRSRVRDDRGSWVLIDGPLIRIGSNTPEGSRTIKAFIALTPKDVTEEWGEKETLHKTFTLAQEYPEIIERIYHHPNGAANRCGDLGEYPLGEGDLGFTLRFRHRRRRALLIEILVPCGKFARLNKFSDDLRKAGFLNSFVKSTYIAYGSYSPSIRTGKGISQGSHALPTLP